MNWSTSKRQERVAVKNAMPLTRYEQLLTSISVEAHLLAECLAMAKHAFSSGLKVPGSLAEQLEYIAAQELGESTVPRDPDDTVPPPVAAPAGSQQVRGDNAKALAVMHGQLSDIIAPATPRTVLLLAQDAAHAGLWGFLGPVRLVRGMAMMAIFCLLAFVALSLSSEVNTESMAKGVFKTEGLEALFNLLFLLTAAGLGGCFAGLFQASRYIAEGTFDPKYESSYWIRFILGLMAGIMLAELIPILGAGDTGSAANTANSSPAFLARPTLAMLGGFSAAVVYRILTRLIEAVESLVRGDTRGIVAAREQTVQARVAEQAAQTRLSLAADLTRLQQQVAANAAPQALQQELDRLLGKLVPAAEEREAGR